MTTDTLTALKKRYREGTITKTEQDQLVDELIVRSDAIEEAKSKMKETVTEAVETFLETLEIQ